MARHGQNSFCVVPGEYGTDIEIVLKGVIRAFRGPIDETTFSYGQRLLCVIKSANLQNYYPHGNHHKRGD